MRLLIVAFLLSLCSHLAFAETIRRAHVVRVEPEWCLRHDFAMTLTNKSFDPTLLEVILHGK